MKLAPLAAVGPCVVVLVAAATAQAGFQPITLAPSITSLDPQGRQRAEFAQGTSQTGLAVATYWDEWHYDYNWPYVTHPLRWNADGSYLEFQNVPGQAGQPMGGSIIAVSPAGVAVGVSDVLGNNGGEFFPTRWDTTSGAASFMQLPAGYTHGYVKAINDSGLSAGWVNRSGQSRAVVWASDGSALGVLPTRAAGVPIQYSSAIDINASGQILGSLVPVDGDEQLVRWNSYTSQPVVLPGLSGVISMNDRGTVLGHAYDPQHPSAWFSRLTLDATAPQAMLGLPSLVHPSVLDSVRVIEMNNADTAIGVSYAWSTPAVQYRAVKWEPNQSQATELSTDSLEFLVPGYVSEHFEVAGAQAYGINDSGVVVGSASSSHYFMSSGETFGGESEQFAIAWLPDGTPINLNTVIDTGSGWRLWRAVDISDDNWITGYAGYYPNGIAGNAEPEFLRMFLMQLPEPTMALPLALCALAFRARKP